MKIEYEFDNYYSHFCQTCSGALANKNLSGSHKELLLYHWNLGVSMNFIQDFMSPRKFKEPNGNIIILLVIINPKFPDARNCAVPACESCILTRSKKRSTNNKKVKPLSEK